MPPRSSSPICERSLDLTLIGIGRRDIPQCSPKHFLMQMFYRTFSGGQRPSAPFADGPDTARNRRTPPIARGVALSVRLDLLHFALTCLRFAYLTAVTFRIRLLNESVMKRLPELS